LYKNKVLIFITGKIYISILIINKIVAPCLLNYPLSKRPKGRVFEKTEEVPEKSTDPFLSKKLLA